MDKTKTTAHKQFNLPVLSVIPATYLRFAKKSYFAALNRNT